MLALTQDQGPDGVTGEPDDFGLADSVVLQVGLPAGNFASPTADQAPKATGWFRKAAGKKPTVRTLDLSALMDPLNIADTAARLNLSLMRWRLVPDLQLEAIANARCLVIGSGTLGCIVARNLVGWGVKSITMVDQSTVSYSNPVRQSLFEFADCANGGKPKAEAAVAALKRIHPLLDANAVNLSIPMPGHAFTEADAHQNYLRLSELIASHDVTFLLTDNRESRWLPTLLACSQNKVLINSALGFDSYLVARHGAAPDAEPHQPGSPRLGCYFCNDVMAPTDSTSQRTLDQMCTVTRPGLAYMAGSLAVEVMSTLLQHPLGVRAPAGITVGGLYAHESQMDSSGLAARDSAASTTCLGVVPHTIRGGVGHWGQRLILGEAYTRCIACSGSVVKALREAGGRGWGPAEAEADRQPGAPDGWDFIQRVLREPILLEDLTGISEIKNAADNIFVDDDDFLIDSDSD
ncbi:hypothetical protein H696_02707 [Fonticula alba]|uniref:Ubiquitin-like modifier-activating enzyme ATG7 n=1 Tax=Fonticula alba TaxID=691883 RepID=A0A058Z8W8_FONAL|nr:hypothetical protein H696_02707 [Fonticula alba]KCV70373.1 hypothetical protein H696_02707 [Fonticula alba]|eukprot:XP_009494889.1 hypothetical protein H696_02707 [Fonticula alba]